MFVCLVLFVGGLGEEREDEGKGRMGWDGMGGCVRVVSEWVSEYVSMGE